MESRKTQTNRFFQLIAVLLLGVVLAACGGGGGGPQDEEGEGDPQDEKSQQVIVFKTTTLIGNESMIQGVARDSQGRIVVAGYSYDEASNSIGFALARYTVEGELDASFGGNGVVTTLIGSGGWSNAFGVAIDKQDRIVAAGESYDADSNTYHFALARYTDHGELDGSFGGLTAAPDDGDLRTGIVITSLDSIFASVKSVAIDSQGRIVVAGQSTNLGGMGFALARYTDQGELDGSFGELTAQPDDGDLRTGIVITHFDSGHARASSVVIDSQDRVVAVGMASNFGLNKSEFVVARYTTGGVLDTSFGGGDGIVTTSIGVQNAEAASVAVDGQNRIVVAGSSRNDSNDDFALVRYTTEGELDTSFGGGDGIVTTPISTGDDNANAVVLDGQGRIVLVGGAENSNGDKDFALVRYTPEGGLDASFGDGNGIVITPIGPGDDVAHGVVLDDQDRIVAAGYGLTGDTYEFALVVAYMQEISQD